MDEFKVLLKAIVDTKDTQAQLNAIKNLSVKIEKLNLDQSAITELRNQLNKNGIDVNLVLGNTSQLQNQAKQTGQQIGNALNTAIKNTMRPLSELKTGTGNITAVFDKNGLLDVEASLNKIKQTYAEFGQVKITNKLFDSDGNIESFRVNIEQVNGDLKETRNFMMAINGTSFSFPDDIIKGSENIVQHLDKTKNAINQTGEAINQLKAKAASDKIQLSIDDGTTSTKIDALRAKFEKLGFTQDEISQKMKSVLDSHNALKSSLSGGDNTAIVSANDKFNQSLKETDNLYKQIKTDSTQYYNTTKQTKLSNDIQNWMSKNSAATKQAKASLQQFLAELNNGRVNVARLDEIRANFQSIDTQMRSVGKLGKSFTQTFSEGIKKFSYWTSSTFLVMKTIQEIKQAVTTVKELDIALVDLKKTTKATNSELENFYHNSNSVAKSLGVSTREVIQATADWSRLGYTIKEAQTLAETSAILSSISPGMSIDTSTETLVSTLKAYGIEAEDALDGVASKINIIGNNLALSNNDIAEILKRSASAMNSANTGLEKTIALGSAAQAIVQDSAVVGTALKSVSTRIRGLDEETEQLSENLVNIKGDVYDLTNQKVSIMIDNDTYKDIYTILDEISQVWDELTDKQHADLLSTLFGTRQTNVGAAILSNFDDARKAMNLFQESSGNAMAEMDIIYDSLDYKMNRLKETGTGIAQNLFDRDEMKSIVDALTTVAEAIDFVTDKVGLFGTMGLGAGLFAGFKNIGKCA